jgi:hypothetical protein
MWRKVFSWIGLPESITGDRDSRLTAPRMRALSKFLGMKLKSSVAYHPQTDCNSERFHGTMLQMLRALVSDSQKDRSEHMYVFCIPALLCTYHNTFHTATGFTPQMNLFGWTPCDIRAPLLSDEYNDSALNSGDADIDAWLRSRAQALRKAHVPGMYPLKMLEML